MNEIMKNGMLNAADYMKNDGTEDCAPALQRLIDENPNRTIYFPDGTYLLKSPVMTPAEPTLSVSLSLAAYAILKASNDWNSEEAMIRRGETHRANDIRTVGSNYYFEGLVMNAKVGFRGEEAVNLVLREDEPGEKGVFENLIIKGEISKDDAFWKYSNGNVLS